MPGRNAVESVISAGCILAGRLRGVLDQIEEDLNELVAIGEDRRQ